MLNELFKNEYVQELAILKHCRLLTLLDDQYEILKANGDMHSSGMAHNVRIKFEKELVDLQLILQEWRAGTTDKDNLIKSRIAKFEEKGKQDAT
jgi:hypothetical protein